MLNIKAQKYNKFEVLPLKIQMGKVAVLLSVF